MKALLLYNPNSGHHRIKKKLNYIKKELLPCFSSLDIVESNSKEHFIEMIAQSCGQYDYLIICGGDGSLNLTINELSKHDNRPILGIIPFGTLNDGVKNLNNPKTLKRSLMLIKEKCVKKVDIIKVNEFYSSYVVTCGAYSDLPYIVGNIEKRIFGRFAYYFHAIPKVFKKYSVSGIITIGEKEVPFIAPFIMILNGQRMGGFRINKKSKINDGKVEIFYSSEGVFNSLLNYFIFRKKLIMISASKFSIKLDKNKQWEIDGEIGPVGNIEVEVLPNFLSIIGK